MSSSAVALSSAYESRWTVMSGPMKGAVRLMSAANFTVGRSPECEFIVMNDPKCSRRHAAVMITSTGCDLTSLNDKNPVLINGREIERGHANDGDVITFGETEIMFNLGGLPVEAEVRFAAAPGPVGPYAGGAPAAVGDYTVSDRRPRGKARKTKKPGGNRLLIYGVLGALVYWLFFTGVKPKDKGLEIRTEQQMQNDIDAATKLREQRENENSKNLDSSVTARQAQENYVRGFRDYREGQYERSLVSFQACLALNPEHTLCNRYLRLAQRKFNELIQYHIVLGRKYRDQNQFKSCRAAFRNVMVMVKDANSNIYKEAKANYEACNAFVEGRF